MEGENLELKRTDSVCPPPEMQLLDYVRNNTLSKIKSILKENPTLIHTIIGHPFDKPILHIACDEFANKIKVETLEILLEFGANLYSSDELHNHKEALHFATLGGNPDVLRTIIKRLSKDKINALSDGNTALNLLIKQGDPANVNFLECVRILLQSGVDVNKPDGKNLTPIFWAAKKKYKETVQTILHESHNKVVDLDGHKLRGKSARDLLKENRLVEDEDLLFLGMLGKNNNKSSGDELFSLLKDYNEDGFVNYSGLESYIDLDDGVETLLQMAVKKGLKRAVQIFLNKGADPNRTTAKTTQTPTELAAKNGYHAILDLLLQNEKTMLPLHILIDILKNIDYEVPHEDIDYNSCYLTVMRYKNKINLEVCDRNKNTALHFAARYGGDGRTLDLLRAGASMASKNKYGVLPIEDIDADTLEKHLDECLETNVENNIDKENLIATFSYKTLMPAKKLTDEMRNNNVADPEAANKLILTNEIKEFTSETRVISYMSKSPELKHLLKHPVITSFLYMKWHRIRWFFYTNLAFYLTFCLSLVLYIVLIYNEKEVKPIAALHSALFYITFFLLAFREFSQMLMSPKTYFFSCVNWVELLLIIFSAIILFQSSPSDDLKKQVSAIVILLAAFELVILIGQHPMMSTNIVMLRTVSANFFKFLLWYSILIMAFSLSFYILFKTESPQEEQNKIDADDNGDKEQNFFLNPGLSLFKTIVMLTGEFDAGSIEFEMYPITSHIIFMLFVFMIAIILFNLLNGLAVSDTQQIKSNAELVGHIARIEHIAYIESMMLGSFLPKSILNLLQKCCCCLPLRITNRFIIPGILTKRVCLFPHFLTDYKLMVYPNQQAKVILSEREGKSCISDCANIYLDKQTTKRTKQLMKMRKEVSDKIRNEETIMRKQHLVIEQQQRCIEELRKEQQVILNKLDYIITNLSM